MIYLIVERHYKYIKIMKKITALLILIIAAISWGTAFPEKNPTVQVQFAEIILKVKPDVIIMPEGTYKVSLSEVYIDSEELKELNRKFHLISIEKMFARKKTEEEVLKEFPEREARAPEEAEEPDLENTFLLRFPELINITVLIEEYEKIEEVIYAEENKTVEIF